MPEFLTVESKIDFHVSSQCDNHRHLKKKRERLFEKKTPTSDFNQSVFLHYFTELDPDPTVRPVLHAADREASYSL